MYENEEGGENRTRNDRSASMKNLSKAPSSHLVIREQMLLFIRSVKVTA